MRFNCESVPEDYLEVRKLDTMVEVVMGTNGETASVVATPGTARQIAGAIMAAASLAENRCPHCDGYVGRESAAAR